MPPWSLQFGKMPASAATPPSTQDLGRRYGPFHFAISAHASVMRPSNPSPIILPRCTLFGPSLRLTSSITNVSVIYESRDLISYASRSLITSCAHLSIVSPASLIVLLKKSQEPQLIIPSLAVTTAKTISSHQFSNRSDDPLPLKS